MILLVGSEKGGTGKTTLATNLATMRALAGRDVLLVDADKQGSSSIWAATRSEEGIEPTITCVTKVGPSTGYDIVKMRAKFDDIIVDAGGRDSVELRAAMMISDAMVIPVKPSQFDIWTLTPMDQIVNDARARGNTNLQPLVCINLASPNPALHESDEVIELVREFDTLRTAKTIIYDRVPFRRAARSGRSIMELVEGDNRKAITELAQLYSEIYDEHPIKAPCHEAEARHAGA